MAELKHQLNQTITQDEQKRELTDEIMKRLYPFDSTLETKQIRRLGPNRDYSYARFESALTRERDQIKEK